MRSSLFPRRMWLTGVSVYHLKMSGGKEKGVVPHCFDHGFNSPRRPGRQRPRWGSASSPISDLLPRVLNGVKWVARTPPRCSSGGTSRCPSGRGGRVKDIRSAKFSKKVTLIRRACINTLPLPLFLIACLVFLTTG